MCHDEHLRDQGKDTILEHQSHRNLIELFGVPVQQYSICGQGATIQCVLCLGLCGTI